MFYLLVSFMLGPKLQLIARTILMENAHGRHIIEKYNNKNWTRMSAKINWVNNPNHLWVSLGSSRGREKFFFDSNSDFSQKLKEEALTRCQGRSVGTCLRIVNEMINQLTRVKGKSDYEVEETLDNKLNEF